MEATALSFGSRVRSVVQKRAVVRRIVSGDLKVKYEGSTLGYLWSVLEPLMLTAVYFVVFGLLLDVQRVEDFALFLIAGVLPWQWVTSTVNGSVKALRDNAKLITKVFVPREIFPLATVIAKSIEFLLSLVVLVIFAVAMRHPPSIYLLAFPLAVLLQLMLLTGAAMILSAANTLLRDVERIIKPVMRVMFYFSPILYPLAMVLEADISSWFKVIYQLNPMVGILQLYHAAWYPEEFHGWDTVAVSAVGATLILALGWRFFTRLERAILKEL